MRFVDKVIFLLLFGLLLITGTGHLLSRKIMEPLPLAWPLSKCMVMSTARMKDIKKNTLKADLS